jgi:ABC-type branched-subunit amino acid transport system substrate-binding protein
MRAVSYHGVTSRTIRVVAAGLAAAALFTASACSSDDPTAPNNNGRPPNQIKLYGTDGNMGNSFGALFKKHPGALDGMIGTTPLTPLSATFKNKLLALDKNLQDYLYAGESYDAVVISALAAETAGTTEPKAIAAQINGVTAGGTTCTTPRACLQLIHKGKDIQYRGISIQFGGFTDAGEPSASMYGTLHFGADNAIDDGKTEYVPAGDTALTTTKPAPARSGGTSGAGPLKIGALLPKTGSLAGMGPPMFTGAELGIKEINAAGGVLGDPVEYVESDDGTESKVAKVNVAKLIDQGVHVIIGASGSSITTDILPQVVRAGVILFSPCNTAASLSTADDKGLYFRTAPADGLQAKALTDIIMRDGARKVYIVARADEYGEGLRDGVKDLLLSAGVPDKDIDSYAYNIDTPDFSNLGAEVKQFQPDAVLVVGFEESADAILAIEAAGLTVHN